MNDVTKMIQELVDLGVCGSIEEAEAYLKSQGVIRDSKGVPLKPEGIPKLKFHGGNDRSPMTVYNRIAKKDKKLPLFDEGSFYLGAEFSKNEDGAIDPNLCNMGVALGDSIEIVIVSAALYANRYVPNGKHNVTTTLVESLTKADQKAMIDFKSKRSAFDIREELFSAYGKPTADKNPIPEGERLKFKNFVLLLIKVDEGDWRLAFYTCGWQFGERDLFAPFNEKVRGKSPSYLHKFILTGETNPEGKLFPKLSDPTALDKKMVTELVPKVREGNEIYANLKKAQQDYIQNSTGDGVEVDGGEEEDEETPDWMK